MPAQPRESAFVSFKRWVESGLAAVAPGYDHAAAFAFLDAGAPHPHACPAARREVGGALSSTSLANLLILGDSANRMSLEGGCAKLGGGSAREWAQGFSYNQHVGAPSSLTCNTTFGRVAFLNLYGSPPRGPYFLGISSSTAANDPWADTELRLSHAIDQFESLFGEPSVVLLKTDIWDSSGAVEAGADPSQRAAALLADYRWLVGSVRARLPGAFVGMQASPAVTNAQPVWFALQEALRQLARDDENLFLLDFGALLAGRSVEDVMRDGYHPKEHFLTPWLAMQLRLASRFTEGCS